MTDPNAPDTTGRAVPPYEGRRTSADVDPPAKSRRDGATVGGATGPVAADDPTGDPADGATTSPADEQPADRAPQTDLDDDRVGPAHQAGTSRGEDQA